MRAGEANEPPPREVLIAAIDWVGEHAFHRVRAQCGEESLGRGPGEVAGPVLLQGRDDIVLLGSGKLREGLAVGRAAIRLERGEAAPIKVLLIRIGARECEIDVIGDAGIGRVLVASLHQGIADVLPARLGFYESWLHAEGLRDGTIGLAPLYAVLSFLRQEGEPYRRITTSAGEYAAEWTVESMGGLERELLKLAPDALRPRLVLRLADRLVQSSFRRGRQRRACA